MLNYKKNIMLKLLLIINATLLVNKKLRAEYHRKVKKKLVYQLIEIPYLRMLRKIKELFK